MHWRVSTRASHTRAPLVRLDRATVAGLQSTLSWTVGDNGSEELWAIVGPASDTGGEVRKGICDIILGRRSPAPPGTGPPPKTHPFLGDKKPSETIASVSFAAKPAAGGEFVDYSTRYGSIRKEDSVTLYESLMETMGVYTGRVARVRMRPDPLAPEGSDEAQGLGTFKWRDAAEYETARQRAYDAHEKIFKIAPLVSVDPDLLGRPVVALSNGQMRRARILDALVRGVELVVLEEPFSGLDATTRKHIDTLFSHVHAQRMPRVLLVLREQDVIPDCTTHVLRIALDGRISHIGRREEDVGADAPPYALGSYEQVRKNSKGCVGVGTDETPVVEMHNVSMSYGGAPVLQNISLVVRPGMRMVVTGDSGSGKTTLLSLLLGDNPRTYALAPEQLRLFGRARDAPQNAHVLLQRRIGHVSPELFAAFPRKSVERGGLDVLETVMSGYDGIFTRRARSEAQIAHAKELLGRFASVITPRDGSQLDAEKLAATAFTDLSHGSQAVVLLLRAMVHRPELLVLDEAFQGMSSRQSAFVREYLDTAQDEWLKRAAIMVVSHYPGEWLLTCGSLLRLEQGVATEQW
ncbi:hypothetical protein MCUN1_001801 [Malassezia cuniculi]|uniref:ABC transporter domain-containing protein n=1 Tax=Malassezia cuniculi TaxID=948313 RepID=A0AAF0ETI3_9BASI|nr:hypothetical protein MCUN1_001801 [Malassezia cuniculi]